MMNFILRVVLVLIGLVFAASLAVVMLLLAAVWGLRYGWARLTGKPVAPWAPWVMRFNPRSGFERFRAGAGPARPAEPTAADMAAARARGESVRSPVLLDGASGDVTDVRPKSANHG